MNNGNVTAIPKLIRKLKTANKEIKKWKKFKVCQVTTQKQYETFIRDVFSDIPCVNNDYAATAKVK